MGNGADFGGGQWRVVLGKERRIVHSIQICQTETHVYKNIHDERYKCIEMKSQDIDNQSERSCNKKTHMQRNKNLIYDCDRDATKKSKDSQKYAKMIIRRPLKQKIKWGSIFKDKNRHVIYKMNKGFRSIIPKS